MENQKQTGVCRYCGQVVVLSEERGLNPVTEQDMETVRTGARMVCSQLAEKVTLQLRSGTICQIGRNAKWEVIIKRTDTRSSKA